MDTGLGKVRIRKSTIPGSTIYQVRWNAGPLTRIGGAGFCDVKDKDTAIKFAEVKAQLLDLVVVDETVS